MVIGGHRESDILKGSPIYFEVVEGIRLGEDLLDFIALNLPPDCNYIDRCKKCSLAPDPDSSRKFRNPISLERTLELLNEARELGAKALAISGEGEPLFIRNLDMIIHEAYRLGYITVVATNGSLITEEKLHFLKEHNVTLTISLDTLDKRKYETHCSGGDFDHVLRNIELCRDVYKDTISDFNGYRIFRASVHSIVSSENIDEISNLKNNCGDDLFFSLGYIAPVGNARNNPELLEDYEDTKRKAEEVTELFLTCKNQEGKTVCGFFYYGITVGFDGEILMADQALDTEGLIGNVREEKLSKFVPKVRLLISKFYETADCFCPTRDTNYNEFVRRCQNGG